MLVRALKTGLPFSACESQTQTPVAAKFVTYFPLCVCKNDGDWTSEVQTSEVKTSVFAGLQLQPYVLQFVYQIVQYSYCFCSCLCKGYHQRSVHPVKMPCYRLGQNHISVFPHLVSKLTFPIAIHCNTNVGSTHTLVILRRGWGKGSLLLIRYCCHTSRFSVLSI